MIQFPELWCLLLPVLRFFFFHWIGVIDILITRRLDYWMDKIPSTGNDLLFIIIGYQIIIIYFIFYCVHFFFAERSGPSLELIKSLGPMIQSTIGFRSHLVLRSNRSGIMRIIVFIINLLCFINFADQEFVKMCFYKCFEQFMQFWWYLELLIIAKTIIDGFLINWTGFSVNLNSIVNSLLVGNGDSLDHLIDAFIFTFNHIPVHRVMRSQFGVIYPPQVLGTFGIIDFVYRHRVDLTRSISIWMVEIFKQLIWQLLLRVVDAAYSVCKYTFIVDNPTFDPDFSKNFISILMSVWHLEGQSRARFIFYILLNAFFGLCVESLPLLPLIFCSANTGSNLLLVLVMIYHVWKLRPRAFVFNPWAIGRWLLNCLLVTIDDRWVLFHGWIVFEHFRVIIYTGSIGHPFFILFG